MRSIVASTIVGLAIAAVGCGSENAATDEVTPTGAGGQLDQPTGTGGGTPVETSGTGGGGMNPSTGGSANGGGGSAGTAGGGIGGAGTGGTAGGHPVSDQDAGSVIRQATCADAGAAAPTGSAPNLAVGRWTNISPPGLYRPRGSVPSYGVMDVHVSPCNPYLLYLVTDVAAMWKSTDGGATWKQMGNLPQPLSSGVMQISRANPNILYYGGGVRGASLGFWISKDGGDTWAQPKGFTDGANNSAGGWTNDVYSVVLDPYDPQHVLLTFHSGFEFKGDAGVLESKDGGTTWIRHAPMSGWGAGHGISFLKDSSTWLLATQVDGYWRTTDSGSTWTRVSDHNSMHGACIATYSKAGVLYVGANNQIMRSTDDGVSFTFVGPKVADGYYQVVTDGTSLFAQEANTGANSQGNQPYVTSPDGDGLTWSAFNDQMFSDGPYRMDVDAANHIIYSANFNDGVWALKTK
jgi:photosystem II stability/assembly factor-like uncharacterized protein